MTSLCLLYGKNETTTTAAPGCSDKVIFADFQKSAGPANWGVRRCGAHAEGAWREYAFACPMGMFRGRLIAE